MLDEILDDGPFVDPIDLLPNDETAPYISDVAHLGPGCSFGELSLIYNKPRCATVKVLQRCHLMVLSRSDFEQCLRDIERKRIAEKVNFMR